MKKNYSYFFYIALIIISVSFAQESNNSIPRDTSYNIRSAYKKVKKKYPDKKIKIVRSSEIPSVAAKRNITYKKINKRELKLDLFSPEHSEEGKLPLVIFIHGGGWVSGNKSLLEPLAKKVAAANYITAVIEYRLAPEARYPAGVYDIIDAIKWLKTNSDLYNVDSSKVALLGCSAGGHLAALVGTANEFYKEKITKSLFKSSSKIQAVIDIDGIVDFTDPAESGKDKDPAKPSVGKRWLGASYKEDPKIWEEASPKNYVNENTPSIEFINSSRERFHAGRDEMIKDLEKYNIYYEIHELPNSPHTFWLFRPWFNKTVNYIDGFLQNRLN